MQIERVSGLEQSEFISNYLVPNLPVIVTDGMDGWEAPVRWSPLYLERIMGELQVQVYDDLFALKDVVQLSSYLRKHFNQGGDRNSLAYVRWYSRLKDVDFVWADDAFKRLENDWATPYFLPLNGYTVPYCHAPDMVRSDSSLFPYRGIFISGQGSRTRLHRDPWTSSAVLCQFYGDKQVIMYAPEQAKYLIKGDEFADIGAPDLRKFPEFNLAEKSFDDVLKPGEILYIPSGWIHEVKSLSDSISITWNFVHEERKEQLVQHLNDNPDDSELDVIRFFLKEHLHPSAGSRAVADFLTGAMPIGFP